MQGLDSGVPELDDDTDGERVGVTPPERPGLDGEDHGLDDWGRLEGNTTSPSVDIAIVSPEISDSVLSVLLAFQQQAEHTLMAARRALARQYPELVSAEAPALEDVWFDPTGAIELHFALPATWPDAMLRVRMLDAEVLEVQCDD